jgi:hypothetical protein
MVSLTMTCHFKSVANRHHSSSGDKEQSARAEASRRFVRVGQQCVDLAGQAVDKMFHISRTSSAKKTSILGFLPKTCGALICAPGGRPRGSNQVHLKGREARSAPPARFRPDPEHSFPIRSWSHEAYEVQRRPAPFCVWAIRVYLCV